MRLVWCLLAALAFNLCAVPGFAADKVPVRFTLDWKFQGIHSWYYLAQQKGYFAKEGLDVTIDQGEGSAATVTRIMSGAYDAGVGDINAIIQNAALRPGTAPVMVYMIFNSPPFVMATLASGPIKTLKDIEGHSVGAPAGSAALSLFQIVAKQNGIDMSKVTVLNMAPSLQEQMLVKKQVDATLVFNITSYINFIGLNVDPDKDIRWLFYKDYGINLYSNGIMVSQKLLKEHPAAVKGLVRAINWAIRDTVKDPDAAIAALAAQEPLLNKALEKRRVLYALRTLVFTPEEAAIGIGDMKDARLQGAIEQVTETFKLPRQPTIAEIFNRSFLPPKAERMLKPAS